MRADKLKAEFEKRQARNKALIKQVNTGTISWGYPDRVVLTETDAGKITLKELQSVARDKGVKYSGLSKSELIKVLADG